MTSQPDHFADDLKMPASLQAALGGSVPVSPVIPAALDAAILKLGHEHVVERRRRRMVRYSLFAATAAAAASLLLVLSLNHLAPTAAPSGVVALNTAHPTILDAFALARELRDRPQLVQQTPGYHITHRPTVDQRDIDALANAAVALAAGPTAPEGLR